MSFVITIILLIWVLRVMMNVLSFAHLWYVKEYRWDRLLIHLKTPQGKGIYFLPFRVPPVSLKSILLVVLTVLSSACVYVSLPLPTLFRILIVDVLSLPTSALWVGVLNVPTFMYHSIVIALAVRTLRSHPSMKIIGITGSFGKTSTKEYLATILSAKFSVLKTEESKNSPIAIAEVVLRQLRDTHEVFIVEMGAYKRGEIAKMSQMVRPEIGIITGINPQHQDLFGSMEVTMKAKYELIEHLIGNQMAILNTDNEKVNEIAAWALGDKKTVWTIGQKVKQLSKNHFHIGAIQTTDEGISFRLAHGKETVSVNASVLGKHQATNITLAIAASVACGMNLKDAAREAKNIVPFKKTMQPVNGVSGSTFINDTFNNNPDAAIAALQYLNTKKGRKFLVFQPMIELGKYANSAHEEVGQAAGAVCDHIVLTNSNFYEAFTRGVKRNAKSPTVDVFDSQKTASFLKKNVKAGNIVLFKGKEAEGSLLMLISRISQVQSYSTS